MNGPRSRIAAVALLAGAALALQGCATIFTGTKDTLAFSANVHGVRLWIDGQYKGELPLTVEQSRNFMNGEQFLARFERAGYQTQEFKLKREFNAVAILDVTSILTSGGIDILTGSLMKFAPREYQVQMLPAGKSAASPEFRRSVDLRRFALTNFRALQKDVARGGGERLAAFTSMVAGGDAAAARLVERAALDGAPALVSAASAPAFVERLDGLLAGSPALAAWRP